MFKKLKKKLRRNRQNPITTSSASSSSSSSASSSSSSSSSLNLDDEEILQSMGAVGGSDPIETASQNKGVGDKKKKKKKHTFFTSVFSSANFFGEDPDKKYKDLLRKHIVCDDSKYNNNVNGEDDYEVDQNFFSFQLDKLDKHTKMKFDILCMCYTSYIEASDKRSAGIELPPGEYEEKLELYTKHMAKVRGVVNCSELEILLHLKKSHAPRDPDAELFRYR